ncbi:2164_t:CDS:1 [Rhizophagus irregularis]|nr:2164_t:CDS:1 [Rhizophagus irregularis]
MYKNRAFAPKSYTWGLVVGRKGLSTCLWIVISSIGLDKSFADDLNIGLGIVSSRVALVLRSAEIKPVF